MGAAAPAIRWLTNIRPDGSTSWLGRADAAKALTDRARAVTMAGRKGSCVVELLGEDTYVRPSRERSSVRASRTWLLESRPSSFSSSGHAVLRGHAPRALPPR